MRLTLHRCLLFGVVLVVHAVFTHFMLSAAEKDAKDYGRFGKVFYPVGLSEFWEKPWVEAETGPANWTREIRGWLLDDRERQVLILDVGGNTHILRKPEPMEVRRRLPEQMGGWVSFDDTRDEDFTVLWGMKLLNFDEQSDMFLKEGAPKEEDLPENILMPMLVHRGQLERHVINAVRYAYLAEKRGRDQHAADLYAHAKEVHDELMDRQVGGPGKLKDVYRFVTEKRASGLRNSAVSSGHYGDSRGELLTKWQRLLAMPDHSFQEEAESMVEGYQQLLTEDGQWGEPTPEERAKFTTEEQLAYWMYKLRDHNAGQWSDPGMCDVFIDGLREDDAPNPAKKIRELGMEAIPVLIQHMEDIRPTRCKGHWRRYSSDGQYLLRYGDCCQQIFESITKHKIYQRKSTIAYPTYDGSAADCKAKAQAWWDEHQKKEQSK